MKNKEVVFRRAPITCVSPGPTRRLSATWNAVGPTTRRTTQTKRTNLKKNTL